MTPLRLILLMIALGMVPFALASYNGATVVGVLAILTFIYLTITESGGGWICDDETSARLDEVDREIGR